MTTSPRCTERGCPVRYRVGPDRPCPLHQHELDAVAVRAEELGIDLDRPDVRTAAPQRHVWDDE